MNELDDQRLDKNSFAYRDIRGVDRWESFTPTFVLTLVGDPTYTGRFRVSGRFCQFQVTAVAATSIASTAGTSYLVLPITAVGLGGMATMTNGTSNVAVGVCHVDVETSRCFLPAQVASGNTFVIAGGYEI